MAIRTNTVEYGFETSNSRIISGSWFTQSMTINIPETASRNFSNVGCYLHYRNSGLETTNAPGECSMSLQIDNNPSQSFYVTGLTVGPTLEQFSDTIIFDASNYFNTYFTSSVHAVTLGTNFRVLNSIGTSRKIIFTYDFEDDNVVTSIKTVRIPIPSVTGSGLTSKVYLGNITGSIPALDTFLPEISKSYKDIFIEYHSNDASAAATNFNLKTIINNGAVNNRFTVSQSLQSAAYYYDIQKLSGSIDTSVTNSLQVSSSLSGRYSLLCGILYCTYQYDYTGSTRILNSNMYTVGNSNAYAHISVINQWQVYQKKIYIPETGSIQMKRSGVLMLCGGSTPTDLVIGQNSDAVMRYDRLVGSVQTGFDPIMFPIDGTGSHLPSFNLQSGHNNMAIFHRTVWSNGGAGLYAMFGGILYLNYESDVTTKPLANTHTVYKSLINNNFTENGIISGGYSSYIATSSLRDSNYFITNCTNLYLHLFGIAANVPVYNISSFACFYSGSEYFADAPNPVNIGTLAQGNDARAYYANYVHDASPFIVQHPNYIQKSYAPRIDLSVPHLYTHQLTNITNTAGSRYCHVQYLTYHSIQFPITGSIQNYSGTGIMSMSIYDYNTGELLISTQSKSGGIIDTSWYDGHTNLMIVAITGSNRYVSNILPAGNSGSFLITIPTGTGPGGPSEYSFTFIG